LFGGEFGLVGAVAGAGIVSTPSGRDQWTVPAHCSSWKRSAPTQMAYPEQSGGSPPVRLPSGVASASCEGVYDF
jgi:hypothetical protein